MLDAPPRAGQFCVCSSDGDRSVRVRQVNQSLAGSKQELAEQLQALLLEKAQLDSSSRSLQQQLDRTRHELDSLRSEHSAKVGAACRPCDAPHPAH
jgi:hypothetical protein